MVLSLTFVIEYDSVLNGDNLTIVRLSSFVVVNLQQKKQYSAWGS